MESGFVAKITLAIILHCFGLSQK